jgi:hypothetical protein
MGSSLMRIAFLAGVAVTQAAVPEQIHIAFTQKDGQLSVDFVGTGKDGLTSVGTTSDPSTFTNTTTTSFNVATIGYMHQGILSYPGVAPGATVYYRVCSAGDCSAVFPIVPIQSRPEVFAVFGDFGLTNDQSMADLTAEAAKGTFDAVLHVGDFAYNLQDAASATGNSFMKLTQGYSATKPTMPVAGNHEACPECPAHAALGPDSDGNFTEYRARFHSVSINSNTGNNLYYSFNRGIVHYIVFSAEAYLYSRSPAFLANQLAFMKADLAAVDRTVTPWVVALVHKDWTMEAEAYAAFAPILNSAAVDILFCGHVHYYNRYLPYDSVTNQTDNAAVSADGSVYTKPKYIVTIVTGASGDREDDGKCGADARPSYTCTQNYGYGFFTPINATHITWSFKTVTPDGPGPKDYSDHLTIIKA